MGHQKLDIILSGLCLAIWLPSAVFFLLANTIYGYIGSAALFGLSCYVGYYFILRLWLYNWGRPLSEKKKRKMEQVQRQWHDYQRNHIYHRIYRFADATEIEYQTEKVKEELKKARS